MAADKETITIDVPEGTRERMKAMQASIRAAGHIAPSQGVLVAALVFRENREGEALESDVLAPFRQSREDVDPVSG